jgi:RNA polymerase sigma-70 factor (ECF subfamily)
MSDTRRRQAPARSAQRDGDGFWVWFQRLTPKLTLWLRLRVPPELRDTFDLDDLLQETALRCCLAADRLPANQDERHAFAFGVARNVLRERFRASVRGGPRAEPASLRSSVAGRLIDPATSPTRRVARSEQAAAAMAELDQLADADRRLVLYHGVEEVPLTEVAAILGRDYETVRKRWQRLRARLRACLG